MSPRRPICRGFFLILALPAFTPMSLGAAIDNSHLRVVIDRTTFAGPNYEIMQQTANQVAAIIDQLIPPPPHTSTDVFCFVAPIDWRAPITVAGHLQPGEPVESGRYETRVAVSRDVLPGDRQRFAFQLAHELGHVKMDPRFDNAIVETFAVALSLETLDRLGYSNYVRAAVDTLSVSLPLEVRAALSGRSWKDVTRFLAERRRYHDQHPFDYGLAVAGAILIRSAGFLQWDKLLGIADKNQCPRKDEPAGFSFCPLDQAALPEFSVVFRQLGYSAPEDTLGTLQPWPARQ